MTLKLSRKQIFLIRFDFTK